MKGALQARGTGSNQLFHFLFRSLNSFMLSRTPASKLLTTLCGTLQLRRSLNTSAPLLNNNFNNPLTPSYSQRSTVYALSTPPGKAGVAVIRISGPEALQVYHNVVKPSYSRSRGKDPEPWKMQRCDIIHPKSGESLDSGLSVFFRGMYLFPIPFSY